MAKKLFALLVANARIHQNAAVALDNEQATHGPIAKVVFVGRDLAFAKLFSAQPKHRATVEFEKAGVNGV